ncbi:flagellar biosynthesis protein FlhB [Photobacterium aphoticum]|uniref:Flagellar biosynthetic protein FlhB n=1 Tax=Photobacterium aphoticum TaxID=754436 RepID=A0A090QYG4_9GAMM|nr:flagellar biosynthesis protein FlhB [Photobacterium aphoticum]
MSESSSQDKTEQPSQQKLRKAREEGNLPRSRELVTALLTLGAALLFGAFSHELVQMAMTVSQSSFQLSRAQAFDPNLMLTLLTDSVMVMIRVITPLLGLLMLSPCWPISFAAAGTSPAKRHSRSFPSSTPSAGSKRYSPPSPWSSWSKVSSKSP